MISSQETDLILKYISHTASERECEELVSWLEESEENKRFFSNICAESACHSGMQADPEDENTEKMLARLNARIDADNEKSGRMRRLLTSILPWGIAAASLILCFVMFKPAQEAVPEESTAVMENQLKFSCVNNTAAVRQVNLEDNTSVFLSSGARIRYDVSGSERRVKLDGEAYFNVAKDSLRPFTVDVGNLKVKVLGTAFSAKSSSEFSNSEVILERGSVRLQTAEGVNLVSMKPNQRAVFSQEDQTVSIEEVYAFSFIQEKYSLVSLTDADIRQIIRCVENAFSVKIRCRIKDTDRKYDLNFLRSDSMGDVVKLVEVLTGEKLEIQ